MRLLSVGLTSLAWLSNLCSADTNHDFNVAEFVAEFDHPRVTLRKNTHSHFFEKHPEPLPLKRVARRSGRQLQRVPQVNKPWPVGATDFDWRDVVDLPKVHFQKHNECYAETAAVTLTALWEMLYEESTDAFRPDDLVKCAHETPGVPALPSDILNIGKAWEPVSGCHAGPGQPSMRLAPKSVELCDLAGDWDIENRLVDMLAMGPVSVGIESANPVFRLYAGGVLSPDQVETKRGVVDHAVSLVGFGEDRGTPYWVIRNSWGEEWGEKGYARVERRKNNTGVLNSYAVVTQAVKSVQ